MIVLILLSYIYFCSDEYRHKYWYLYIAEADVRQERVLKDKNHIISMKVPTVRFLIFYHL